MKTILALLAALITTTAQADCGADVATKFEQLRAVAVDNYPQAAALLANTTAAVGVAPNGANAITTISRGGARMIIDRSTCGGPEAAAVIAHELGHVAAWVLLAPQRAKFADFDEEHQANYYGAKLLTQTERGELMAYLNVECKAERGHDTYWCDRAASWEYSFTH